MGKYLLLCITLVLFATARVDAQDSYTERVKKYIDEYGALALSEQRISGIPACITLGQGILETEAGASELMTEANNHFGIKCNSKWVGPTFTHTDDAPDECFKKYTCAAESYHDHSMHLRTNARYQPLFKLSTTDYAAWAVCLKKCGYATNPQYAQRLIKIIEDFKLQEYTYSAMDTNVALYTTQQQMAKPVADSPLVVEANKSVATPSIGDQIAQDIAKAPAVDSTQDLLISDSSGEDTSKVEMVNGMRAFYAHKGEMLLGYAVKYNIRYPKLLENNDLKDGPLPYDMYLYLEKKMTTGTHLTHEVAAGENMLLISQKEGIQLKRLAALNLLYPNEEPAVGTVLQLQTQATKRPEAAAAAIPAHKGNAIDMGNADTDTKGDYIVINKPAAPIDTTMSVPEEKTTEITKPVVVDAPKPPVAPVPVRKIKEPPKPKQEAKSDEDLADLKANLDKVVYADNSKLHAEKPVVPAKKEVVNEAVKNAPVSGGPKFYTIKKGETAFSIAKRNNITVDQLYKWNDIDASGIKVGKSIRIKE